MKLCSCLLLALSLIIMLSSCQEHQMNERLPNIVLIFADDLGYGDLSCYGALNITTPHLDQLARDGMKFTQFYSVQAVCSASRAALLTGCYPNRIGISGAYFPGSNQGLNPQEETIAELLKPMGYATAIYGKWHLGHLQEFLPLQHGFDEYFGIPYSNDMWPVDYDGTQVDSTDRKIRFPQLPLIEGNRKREEVRTLEDQGLLTKRYTEHAVDFIRRNQEDPFFLYLPHSMPHVPIAASPDFQGKSKQGTYGDVIMEIDWSVGQIVATLDELELTNNTLLIFTSDNGPWLNYGNHAGTTGGLREGKGTSFEGGQREPCIMKWPGKIPEGTICQHLAATIDILPTIVSILGGESPKKEIDGVDITDLMFQNGESNPRNTLWYYYGKNNLEAVRKDHWKLILPHWHRTYEDQLPGNDGFPGSQRQSHFDSIALFNLRRDPGERYDVKNMYPDVVDLLQEEANRARTELGDDLTEIVGQGNRPVGEVGQ